MQESKMNKLYTVNGRSLQGRHIAEIIEECINDAFLKVQNKLNIDDGGGFIDIAPAMENIFDGIEINIAHNQQREANQRDAMRAEIRAEIEEEYKTLDRLNARRDAALKAEAERIFTMYPAQDAITITISTNRK